MRPEVEQLLRFEGDEFRDRVLGNAMALSHELKDVPEGDLQRMREVVVSSWPEDGVRAHVERGESEIRFTDHGAYAWLTLAPGLDVVPTREQWADLATSGAVMTDTADWLRRHYAEEAAVIAARTCNSHTAREWGQLLSAVPTEAQMPAAVIDSIIEHVDSVEEPDFDLWHIGERLAGEGRLDALQALSANGDELERGLRQWRAGLGEFEAARLLLVEMTPALREGRRREWDDAEWLEGSTSPDLLPLLFDALAAALEVETDDPFGPARALQRAIYRIGGDEAVRSYDELIASSDESRFKFLRLHRDELVQAELRRAGQARVAEVAEALELPVLEPMEGP